MKYRDLSAPEKWILKGIPTLFVIGTIMHFAYDLSKNNPIVGLFAAVNESIWEHSKMVLIPVILWWVLYYYFKGKQYSINKNKWFQSALVTLIISLITIPMLYYFYTQAFGVELLVVDIIILLLAIIFGQLLGLHIYKHGKGVNSSIIIIVFIVLIVMFMIFTFYPPHIPLFQDGISGGYGINKM
ncbi:DUF6512 family protein [Clostridium sp. LIBA-8841]|uniref:DUF6512 family protein n=1 Tax=Clostridium sp. LIBA-8841 TaxID=2987530 RepID=UPI002AC3C0B5|nr:DUF6512 family protein [Clostridium sp. LIBA-8841]MDZ5253734.1 DUF6512 family protein [Clostridium sp. LIBA-8841]